MRPIRSSYAVLKRAAGPAGAIDVYCRPVPCSEPSAGSRTDQAGLRQVRPLHAAVAHSAKHHGRETRRYLFQHRQRRAHGPAFQSIDVAQVTYLHYATALDKGFDIVGISGQINGGSQILVGNDLAVEPGDWEGLKRVIAQYKDEGKPFRVAASRGNAQDIHMRGAFLTRGIDINKDVRFINIPNPSDHVQALRRGEVELITSVDPFATQIREVKAAKFFDFPYEQAAGN